VHYCDVFLPDGFGTYSEGGTWHSAGMIVVNTQEERYTKTNNGKGIGGIYWFNNKTEIMNRIKDNPKAKTMGEVINAGLWSPLDLQQIDIGTPEAYREYLKSLNTLWGNETYHMSVPDYVFTGKKTEG
jgi:hypothetical protein